jgi:hypothetical protein
VQRDPDGKRATRGDSGHVQGRRGGPGRADRPAPTNSAIVQSTVRQGGIGGGRESGRRQTRSCSRHGDAASKGREEATRRAEGEERQRRKSDAAAARREAVGRSDAAGGGEGNGGARTECPESVRSDGGAVGYAGRATEGVGSVRWERCGASHAGSGLRAEAQPLAYSCMSSSSPGPISRSPYGSGAAESS